MYPVGSCSQSSALISSHVQAYKNTIYLNFLRGETRDARYDYGWRDDVGHGHLRLAPCAIGRASDCGADQVPSREMSGPKIAPSIKSDASELIVPF